MKKLWLLVVAVALITGIFVSAEVSGTQESEELKNPIAASEESIEAGKQVFFEYCSGCHGRRADGRGRQSLNLNPKPQNLRNAPFVKYLTDERLYTSISGGVRGTSMPAFDLMLSKDKRWHVINYLRSLTAHDELDFANSVDYEAVPMDLKNPLEVNEQNISGGKNLWLNYCASCHGVDGDGHGLLAASLVPAPRNLVVVTSWGEKPFIDYMSDARLYDSLTNGVPGTSMLPWIGVFDKEQRWQIITYLRAEAKKQIEKIETQYQ